MNLQAVQVLKELLKNGMISRQEKPVLWGYLEDADIRAELEEYEKELDFTIWSSLSRAYLVPNQDNELFLQNNVDFRRDIKGDARLTDLYLMNYLAIYLLFVFFRGERTSLQVRDFISKEDFISVFTAHCEQVVSEQDVPPAQRQYGLRFREMAELWLTKIQGEPDAKTYNTKYGCLNRLLIKLRIEKLFDDREGQIRPLEKCRDLMPYFLSTSRIDGIHRFLEGAEQNAAD